MTDVPSPDSTEVATNQGAPMPTVTPDPEVIYVNTRRVACDGGGGALGHPVVWYSLEDGEAECMYCDRKFIYRADAEGNGAPGVKTS